MPVRNTEDAKSASHTLRSHPVPRQLQLTLIDTRLSDTRDGPRHIEYRVYNWRKLDSGRVWRGDGWGLGDAVAIAVIAWLATEIAAVINPPLSLPTCWDTISRSDRVGALVLWSAGVTDTLPPGAHWGPYSVCGCLF